MHALTGKAVATVVFLAVAIALLTGLSNAEIANNGYESGLDSWTSVSVNGAYPKAHTTYVHTGVYSAHFYCQEGNPVPELQTNSTYKINGSSKVYLWVYTTSTTSQRPRIYLKAVNGTYLGPYIINETMTKDAWNYVSVSFSDIDEGLYNIKISATNSVTYYFTIDDLNLDGELPLETHSQIYEISIVDSMTGSLVTEASSCFKDSVNGTWFNYTAYTGQHYAELMANTSYDWYVSKIGYTTYNETFNTAYITYGGQQVNGIKSCTLINMMEPNDTALTYVTFRVTANSRLTGAQVALDDGQSKLTDGDGVAFFVVPKYADYNYQVKYTGYYPYYGTFNLTNSTYVDVHLISKPTSTVTPIPTLSPGIPVDPPESIDTLLQEYKDFCNSTIGGILNATYEGFNGSVGQQFRSYNDSIVLAKNFLESQYNNSTGYGYIYSEFLGLIFGFIPIEVKAQIAYFFLWILMLIILGR